MKKLPMLDNNSIYEQIIKKIFEFFVPKINFDESTGKTVANFGTKIQMWLTLNLFDVTQVKHIFKLFSSISQKYSWTAK